MANKTYKLPPNSTDPTDQPLGLLFDMGDGTYGERVAANLRDTSGNQAGMLSWGQADGVTAGNVTALVVGALGWQLDGAGLAERVRGNINVTAISSAARTATNNSGDLTNYNGRGLHVVLDVTAAGTGSITITIQGKDAVSGQYYTLLAGAAVTTNSTNTYKVYPGLTAAANAVASDILPRTYRILITHNNANSITYSVGVSVVA